MLDSLVTLWNVLLVLVGFGFVIFWHELGHFLAARWAKIRVLEFAVGFGPAIVAYRKGVGVRRGSTNAEYQAKLDAHRAALPDDGDRDSVPGVSQTEYRLNWIPLGGYVRMLGQEDANPGATSDAPDSYGSVAVWKRMIVVSGGVVMNVVLAAVLFVVVYAVGLESNAPAIEVQRGSAAERAGLETGDVVRTVNGKDVEVFQDLLLTIGLAKKDEPVVLEVERGGVLKTINVEPEYNEDAQIRAIGVYAMSGATVVTPDGDESLRAMGRLFASFGMGEVRPGWTLVGIDGAPNAPVDVSPWGEILLPTRMLEAARASGGRPIPLAFETPDGAIAEVTLTPAPEFDATPMEVDEGFEYPVEQLLGLTPTMLVREVAEAGEASGLASGDVFARLGGVDWPNVGQGVRAIRA
ncbi:MAG: site-2 protease family protein, partial [Planctomycetota bacterium]